jgi:hypothetical protein
MGRAKTSNKRLNVMMTEENDRLARSSYGGISHAVNLGLELLFHYNVSIYIIKHRIKRYCFIGIFFDQRVTDVHYHHVFDLGHDGIGRQIRKEGPSCFEFKVIAKMTDLEEAVILKNLSRKIWLKRGYSQPYSGFDDSET